MSEQNVHAAKEPNDLKHKLKDFWYNNQRKTLVAVSVLLFIVAAWFAYQSFVVLPKEQQAADAIYKAQEYFGKDSVKLALNGDAGGRGFLYIIKNYSGTKSANLAKYYAGVCYLRTGDFTNAVKYLQDFTTDAKQIQMMAYGSLGDAYGELNKNEEAIESYKRAEATFSDDENMASEYLYRAASKLELASKTKDAVELFKKIKEKYPNTERGRQIEKDIYRLSIEPNDFSTK